jgi:hypothetical protein
MCNACYVHEHIDIVFPSTASNAILHVFLWSLLIYDPFVNNCQTKKKTRKRKAANEKETKTNVNAM